ncbi:protein of unknown function [Pseudodesulfovibrio piezophilus C1TLV30]|uniref:Uncharacterized protein n=1 Tax=Pseudodesulfovibrio piezophilus (strain DSM 21447 / JCM 15486 / C1TLV30) TaxID=1322246 RepID=M1WQ59_PSEP2|nr:protein of unknown function [Pseudodesulfovibrio piezophilus C1TLV30]
MVSEKLRWKRIMRVFEKERPCQSLTFRVSGKYYINTDLLKKIQIGRLEKVEPGRDDGRVRRSHRE